MDCMLISLSRVAMAPFGSFIDVHSRDNTVKRVHVIIAELVIATLAALQDSEKG